MEALPEMVLSDAWPDEVAVNVPPLEKVKENVAGMLESVPGVLFAVKVAFPKGLTVPEPDVLNPLVEFPVPWPVALMEI